MRKTFIIATLAISSTMAVAGEKGKTNIPQKAQDAFKKDYPGAQKLKWEKEDGNYEASFSEGDLKMSVVYTKDGMKQESEISIPTDKLPGAAVTYASKKGKIKDAAEITKADGTILYEAHVGNVDLIFDKSGKFVKESKD